MRPHLEYAASAWNPTKIKDIEAIENVQRRATKLLPGYTDLSYSERLKKLNLPSLANRRMRGDIINVFKVMNNLFDSKVTVNLFTQEKTERTRGHSQKLTKNTAIWISESTHLPIEQ